MDQQVATVPKRQPRMELRAHRVRNVRRGIVPMAFVVTIGASERAKRARPRKKAVASMAYAVQLPMIRIRTKNAGAARAMARAFANNTTAFRALENRSVCPTIAWMVSAAEIYAIAYVTHAPKPAKAKDTMVFVARLRPAKIPTTNAIRANVAVLVRVIKRKRPKQTARRACQVDNVRPSIAWMASVATPHAFRRVWHAPLRKKVAALREYAG
jgi:hypothetical protein